jgi:phosphodiesterase/alkaline phosphatase D-like protein
MPFSFDSWSGYPAARERFLASIAANARNPVFLCGDIHTACAATVRNSQARHRGGVCFSGGDFAPLLSDPSDHQRGRPGQQHQGRHPASTTSTGDIMAGLRSSKRPSLRGHILGVSPVTDLTMQ